MKSAAPVDLYFRPDDLRVPPRLTSGPAATTTPDVPGSERHQVRHERQCRVAGCKCGDTTFPNVTALGKHLVSEHNRGKMDACYWPACSHRHNRASSNHRLHLRLHNLAVPTEHRVVFDPPSRCRCCCWLRSWSTGWSSTPPPDIKLEEDSTDSNLSGESDEDGSSLAANSQNDEHDHDQAQNADADDTSDANIGEDNSLEPSESRLRPKTHSNPLPFYTLSVPLPTLLDHPLLL
ncbi:hypothetical protein G7054_g1101 [Neopestalotiopsis clavispora]|nr:hypothetical protein G7054_g1101 [Neopestalotiopsis clavispora]